jgi:putative transposase
MYFHVWFATKYREATLEGEIDRKAKDCFSEVACRKNYNILEMQTNMDHVHMLVEAEHKRELASMIRAIKCVSAKKILEDTPHLRVGHGGHGRHFWARRYGWKEVPNADIDNMRSYIRNQKRCHTR